MSKLTYDVVVLGGGGAGLAAAARASELGLSVAVLERATRVGGTTRLAVGSIAAASGGPPDSPDLHASDIGALAGDGTAGNETLLHNYVRGAPATLAWLGSLGVSFLGPVHDDGSSARRLYNALPHSGIYIHTLQRALLRSGGWVQTGFTASRLVCDNDRIIGVEGSGSDGEQSVYLARRAVIMATGDFSGNDRLKRQHLGSAYPPINTDNDGSGFQLATHVGAILRSPGSAGWAHELRFVAPTGQGFLRRLPLGKVTSRALAQLAAWAPSRVFGEIVTAMSTTHLAPSPRVQVHGARLLSAQGTVVDWGSSGNSSLEPGVNYAVVFDRDAIRSMDAPDAFVSTAPGIAYASLSDYRRFRKDLWTSCETLEEIAARLRAPTELVAESLAGRSGPFVLLGPARAVQILTDGGLEVDASHRVTTEQGAPIPGLYAVGAAGQSSLVLPGHGNHLGWALTSGRMAAEQIHRQESGRDAL